MMFGYVYQRISAPKGQFPSNLAYNYYWILKKGQRLASSEFVHEQDNNRPEVNISVSHVYEETQTVQLKHFLPPI